MMIFKGTRWFQEIGVLGMNRRNAEYILRCNPRSSFPIVDDKVRTKRLAEGHQIPIPPLYHMIESHGDIGKLKEALQNRHQFVLKPARGAGGSGIVLVTDHRAEGFVQQSGEIISWKDLAYHISDILSGVYSLEGLEDCALIEALVHPDPIFDAVTYRGGIPDIRIIVYRGVPVMGMVRLPTRASEGKANLHRGAIGVGIDMGRGETLMGVHGLKVLDDHPDTGNPVRGIVIPYWKQMLFMAAQAVDMTNLGFLGVDIVIDREQGPLLLELNARPGLQIQVANQAGLLRRLELIDKAPPDIFATLGGRISWAVETFTA